MKKIDVANVLLQNSSEEVLLLQRAPRLKRPYLWGLPGGMIDLGETALQAGIRELTEETGINERAIAVKGIKRFLVQMPDENVRVSNIHAILLQNEETVNVDPNEHLAYRWSAAKDIYASYDLLPCIPTMVAQTLGLQSQLIDRTITPGIHVVPLQL